MGTGSGTCVFLVVLFSSISSEGRAGIYRCSEFGIWVKGDGAGSRWERPFWENWMSSCAVVRRTETAACQWMDVLRPPGRTEQNPTGLRLSRRMQLYVKWWDWASAPRRGGSIGCVFTQVRGCTNKSVLFRDCSSDLEREKQSHLFRLWLQGVPMWHTFSCCFTSKRIKKYHIMN